MTPTPNPPSANQTPLRVGDLAHARSGDKGNRANVAVLAFDRAGYALLRERLTAEALERFLAPAGVGRVVRHEMPNVLGLNFAIENALAGGAAGSLRVDTQGKALAEAVKEMRLDPP